MYLITCGGGARLLTTNDDLRGSFHYVLAKRRNEGYLFTVYDMNEKIRDEFSINKRGE